jgi:hypothetical protein
MTVFRINTECEFAASPCSNLALLYTFYGIAVALSSHNIGYLSAVYAALLFLSLWTNYGLDIFDTTFHFCLGLVPGYTIAKVLRTVMIAPTSIAKHTYQVVLYIVQLAVAVLVFAFVDEVVPENGFPVGLWMSFLAYVLYFGALYFVNFKYGAFDTKNSTNLALFTRTYVYWFLALIPYYATASLLFWNRYVSGVIATALTIALTFAFRLRDDRVDAKTRNY